MSEPQKTSNYQYTMNAIAAALAAIWSLIYALGHRMWVGIKYTWPWVGKPHYYSMIAERDKLMYERERYYQELFLARTARTDAKTAITVCLSNELPPNCEEYVVQITAKIKATELNSPDTRRQVANMAGFDVAKKMAELLQTKYDIDSSTLDKQDMAAIIRKLKENSDEFDGKTKKA
jgi:hypothetical protein